MFVTVDFYVFILYLASLLNFHIISKIFSMFFFFLIFLMHNDVIQ